MRRAAVLLAVAAQLAVLVWIAGEREWILRTGQVVYLRTAPVDPRDLFRGDFVRLQYEVNSVEREDPPKALAPGETPPRHEVVYTRLRPAGEGLYEAAGTSAARPASGIFLRGRTEDSYRLGWRGPGHTLVKYGIEQLYVEQGAGRAIERRAGARNGMQVPIEVEVAVSSSGTAVIRGYRWSRLGIRLEVLRRPAARVRNQPPQGPLSPSVRVTLSNASDAPLAIADGGEHCAFHLVQADFAPQRYPPASQACAQTPAPLPTILLAPGESYSVEIDFATPRWQVLDGNQPVEIGALRGFPRFRIEYRAPESGGDAALWHGRLASAAFNASGAVD